MSDLSRIRPARGEPPRCPLDGSRLVEVERSGILIDACPECRGIWLDRGELDRLLERERRGRDRDDDEDFFSDVEGRRGRPAPPRLDDRHDDRRYDERSRGKRRRRSILEDLFDFD